MQSRIFSQPSIYIDGWLYAMRMTSVVCNVSVLSQNDSTYHHSVFTTWKWHPFATWMPSFIILVWGHHPPLRRTIFACLQNCYNSCISCSRSALRYDSINTNLMNYSWTNGRLAIPAPAGLLVIVGYCCAYTVAVLLHIQLALLYNVLCIYISLGLLCMHIFSAKKEQSRLRTSWNRIWHCVSMLTVTCLTAMFLQLVWTQLNK